MRDGPTNCPSDSNHPSSVAQNQLCKLPFRPSYTRDYDEHQSEPLCWQNGPWRAANRDVLARNSTPPTARNIEAPFDCDN